MKNTIKNMCINCGNHPKEKCPHNIPVKLPLVECACITGSTNMHTGKPELPQHCQDIGCTGFGNIETCERFVEQKK